MHVDRLANGRVRSVAHHPFPWREAFLASLREVPVVSRACEVVGIERSTAYRAAEADPTLREAWDDALETGVDKAEAEAFRRAVEGTDKGVWHQGSLVGTERVYSDSLLALVLKGRRKKVYADRTELTGAEGGPVQSQQLVVCTGVPDAVPSLSDLV